MSASRIEALDNDQYTVGWICALEIELVATRQFLDRIHDRPKSKSRNDKNSYVLGEAEGHNVVVAVLPDGVYGTTSATRVLEHMLGSFTNVRIGFMVGIGGGAPSKKNNIMLGDVVVSVPRNNTSGIFQYRYGKDIQGKDFLPTGHLNRTPSSILAAVNNLGSEFATNGNNIRDEVEAACALIKKEFTRNKCKRPTSVDQLYGSGFTHPDSRESCITVCASNTQAVVDRSEWSPREDEPMIFRGIIASSDQLMKNALVRDKWSEEKDVLCFEMESAGLMQDFPCVAIRGICDYPDTHKNDVWHGYAAMSAAAYAKNLLRVMIPDEILGELPLAKVAKIEEQLSAIEELTSATHAAVAGIDAKQSHLTLGEWLCGNDEGFEDIQASTLRKYWPGTAKWITDRLPDEFHLIWLSGGPGTGKSVLASCFIDSVLQDEKGPDLVYAFLGYQYSAEKRTESIVAALLRQLIGTQDEIPYVVQQTFKSHSRQNKKLALSTLTRMFCEVAREAPRILVVVDGLDEYPREERERLFNYFLDKVLTMVNSVGVLVTSRCEPSIARYLHIHLAHEIKMASRDTYYGIGAYIRGRLDPSNLIDADATGRSKRCLQVEDPKLRDLIAGTLLERSNGVFLWVDLQLNLLSRQQNEKGVLEALRSLPGTLFDSYFCILQLIEEEEPLLRGLVIKCLMWSIYSRMGLRLYELRDAIVMAKKQAEIAQLQRSRRRYTIANILDVCRSLLVFGHDDYYMRDPLGGWSCTKPIHFSFWEFIIRDDRVLQTKFRALREKDSIENYLAIGLD